jgi:transposase-like protein
MPKQNQSPAQKFTIRDFNLMFPNDASCLEWLKNHLYPDGIVCKRCKRVTKHHRVASRPSYCCDFCGNHVHPMADTIYNKSPTPLRLWFYAIYLMASTRCGISAKQIQRETGVTYKTAWRMFKQIRSMLNEDGDGPPLSGEVEADETYMGGKAKNKHKDKKVGQTRGPAGKTIVAGVVERKGRVHARKVANVSHAELLPFIKEKVLPSSLIFTDELPSYEVLPTHGYAHKRVHHASKVYVDGDAHTCTIDGFWSLVKNGIRGVYHAVSDKYLQSYLDEYSFRYNRRDAESPMFKAFLGRIRKVFPVMTEPSDLPA